MAERPDDAILRLPVAERPALIDSIWERIGEDAEGVLVDEEATAEMQRRLGRHRHDPGSADDLDAVLTRLRASN